MTATGRGAGVDVGGTFTDGVAIAPDGRIAAAKVLSTPEDQGIGVVGVLDALPDAAIPVVRLVHGTTVVTNLLLERTGARVVLCTSVGATDLLELRRQDRAALYDLGAQHPTPLVPPADVVPVPERRTPDGVLRPLTEDGLASVVRVVLAREPEIVVVSLLHAYADDAHEQALATALRAARPGLEVVTSADVLPEIREYERTATAVAEGYARPRVMRYLEVLSARLRASGRPAPAVMTSGGGRAGWSCTRPKTANELVKTTVGWVPRARQADSMASVAARLLRMPRSKSASHSPLTAAAR